MKLLKVAMTALLVTIGMQAQAITPGGLVASHNYGSGTAATMSVTITIEKSPPTNSSLFWAQQFFPNATIDHGGYFGLQTGGIIGNTNVGKMLIFSIWNADSAEAGPGATAQTFGGEGIGYSVRMPFSWSEGTAYRFSLEKDGALWWKLTVVDDLNTSTYLGRIRITQDVVLRSGFASFSEYFGNVASCGAMPAFRAIFSNFRFGTASVAAADSTAYGSCITFARGRVVGNSAVHEVGTSDFCSLDIDGDGLTTATIDGLIHTRLALGFTGTAVVSGINFPAAATRRTWTEIRNHLVKQCGMQLPV